MDANVLIDFCEADRTIIPLISENIGQVFVPLPLLREEVQFIGMDDCEELRIVPLDPPLSIATKATTRRIGLSFYDHLCLLLAQNNRWTCVTNDGRLRRECSAEKVPVLWGLETVALVVERGALAAAAAKKLAGAIQQINPRYTAKKVMARFLERIDPYE